MGSITIGQAEAEAEQERATSSTGASVESCGGAQQGKQDVAAAGAVGADVDMGVRGQERAAREAEVARGERAVAEQQVQAKEEEVEYITPDWCPAITTNPKTGFKQWEMVVEVPALKTETTKAKLVWLDEMQQAGVLHLTVYPYRLHLPLKQLGMPAGFDFYSSTVECAIKRTAVTPVTGAALRCGAICRSTQPAHAFPSCLCSAAFRRPMTIPLNLVVSGCRARFASSSQKK
jgi:hypothetical protein